VREESAKRERDELSTRLNNMTTNSIKHNSNNLSGELDNTNIENSIMDNSNNMMMSESMLETQQALLWGIGSRESELRDQIRGMRGVCAFLYGLF
jgi:hypothetical protein